jgi:spore germination cell wall hydrolase CwlJ-like protein
MTQLIEKQENWEWLKWGEGFLIGLIVMLLVSLMIPNEKPETKIVHVPVTKVIEKEVVKKVPVKLNNYDKRQIQCLAENAYFEAGNQSTKGKIAVTNVVMNRVKDSRFPDSPCAVVNQKAGGVCQFSWVCEGKKKIRDWAVYSRARKVAEDVYLKNVGDVTRGAKFYHADYVSPSWGRVFKRTTVIGDHIFYKG